MEGVAYLSHRFLMHGPLWCLHRSHHEPRKGRFERNDLFGLIFAVPSVILIFAGTQGMGGDPWWPGLPLGLGMTAYGLVYWIFHDVIVHRRVRLSWHPGGRYMRHIIRAHVIHHRTQTREGAVSFGFLFAPRLETPRRQRL